MEQGSDHPEIPQLKKQGQKKERKGGAAAGSGGAGGGSAAGGGSILGGSSPVGASKTGLAALRLKFGEMLAAFQGKAAAGAGIAKAKLATAFLVASVAGGGYVGYSVLSGVKNPGTPNARPPGLPGLVSSIVYDKHDRSTSPSLYHAGKAAKGMVKWLSPETVAAADAAAEDEWEREGAGGPDADALIAGAQAQAGKTAGDIAGKVLEGGLERRFGKLSSEIGGGGRLGDQQMLAGGGGKFNLRQLDASLNPAAGNRGLDTARAAQLAGKTGGMRRGRRGGARVSSIDAKRFAKGMGQLKFANKRSYAGAKAGQTETQSMYAAQAFDGQTTQGSGDGGIVGGEFAGISGSGTGSSSGDTSGSNSGDWNADCPAGWEGSEGDCTPGDIQGPENISPDQALVDACTGMVIAGAIMIMIGALLVKVSDSCGPYKAIVYAIGVALCLVGIVMGLAVLAMGLSMQAQGYKIEYGALGALMMVCGIAGIANDSYKGVAAIAVVMALALVYVTQFHQDLESNEAPQTQTGGDGTTARRGSPPLAPVWDA